MYCLILFADIGLQVLTHEALDFKCAGFQLTLFLWLIQIGILYLAQCDIGFLEVAVDIHRQAGGQRAFEQL